MKSMNRRRSCTDSGLVFSGSKRATGIHGTSRTVRLTGDEKILSMLYGEQMAASVLMMMRCEHWLDLSTLHYTRQKERMACRQFWIMLSP
jgi:hypothetical protein